MVVGVLVVLAAYALGTFPTAQLVGRWLGFDPTTTGSGNPGASNSTRVGGWRAGAFVLAGDLGKGAIAAAAGLLVDGRALGWLAGAAAVAGHMWPAQRSLRGGKGVATAAGVGLVCEPIMTLALGLVFVVVVKATSIAALGSIVISALLPAALLLLGRPAIEVATGACIGLAVIVRHQTNIRRLFRGEESSVRSPGGD